MLHTVIFYGRSGAGKGTQAKMLIDHLEKTDPDHKVLYIETGQKFREFISNGNFTGEKVASVLKEGGLLPEFLPIWVWTDFLIKNYTNNEHLVLDGLSRRISEAPVLDGALKFYLREHPVVIHVNVSREVAKAHLLGRGRADDKEEDIDRRLDWYDTNVVPTLEYFKDHPHYRFADINGEQPIEKVHADILQFLKEHEYLHNDQA